MSKKVAIIISVVLFMILIALIICEIWISGMEYFYEKCLRTFDGIAITV